VTITAGWRRFLLHAALALLPAALLFLWTCDFFAAWDGRAVSLRPTDGAPVSRTVLIVEAPPAAGVEASPAAGGAPSSGRSLERQWPSALVQELQLPVDALALAPDPIPPERPATHKRRFSLTYEVQALEGWRTVPTTSPQALGLALLVWASLLALRNMAVGGAPWSVEPHDRYDIPVQERAGQPVAPTARRGGSKPGPPPPRPVRGRGRR
jgi:hypothetical protein